MPGPSSWTPADIERLRALWAEGKPCAEIAAALYKTKSAIIGKAHRLGLEGRPSPIRTAKPRLPPAPQPDQPDVDALIKALIDAAKMYGWQEDQGTNLADISRACRETDAAAKALRAAFAARETAAEYWHALFDTMEDDRNVWKASAERAYNERDAAVAATLERAAQEIEARANENHPEMSDPHVCRDLARMLRSLAAAQEKQG